MTKDVFAKKSLRNPKNFAQARTNMMKQQIRTWDVSDEKILALFYEIPREDFVPSEYRELAFAEIAIPLGHGQTMMSPREEARVLQELTIKPQDKVLVLGTDSGYLINLLSRLAGEIYYRSDDLPIFEEAKEKIVTQKLPNVQMMMGNVNHGWQSLLPFDVILLTGSLPTTPEDLKQALTIGGRLFLVAGQAPSMEALLITRLSAQTFQETKLFETMRPRLLDTEEDTAFKF